MQPEDSARVPMGSASDRLEMVTVGGEQVLEARRCCLALRLGRRMRDFTLRGKQRRTAARITMLMVLGGQRFRCPGGRGDRVPLPVGARLLGGAAES